MSEKIRPTTIVLFGITGDLAQKKLLPAMYDLYTKGKLGDTRIVGFSRRDFTKDEIRKFVQETLSGEVDERFLDLVTYVQGQFDDPESYQKLGEHLVGVCDAELGDCSNKLFYLSVPPTLYEMISRQLSSSGLSIPCGGADGFARILVEKPFGKDLETARELDALLGELFDESQIYRIDHYIAKESLLNIINLHRKKGGVGEHWNKESIEKIEINLFETAVVGSRGASYDGVGAFRDVGQNHMLQIVALLAMDVSESMDAKEIQSARAEILENILPATVTDLKEMKRGQYDGYLSEPGVASDSNTETFFELTVRVGKGSLSHVPFVLRSGKGLSENKTEVVIHFKDGTKTEVTVPPVDSLPAYQKIFLDCILGDQTVFVSTREILAEWAFVTPIVESVSPNKPFVYEKGTFPM